MRYLAIDQGGTKTCALVCDEKGHILGVGQGAGACWSVSGMEEALRTCSEAVREAGSSWQAVDVLCAGMTGADWPEEYVTLREALRMHTGIAQVRVINDCQAAFHAGSVNGWGVCVCAGTATNACYVTPSGETGCLGYFVNVPHLGKAALEAAIDGYTGVGEKTALTEIVVRFYQAQDMEAVVRDISAGRISARSAKYMTRQIVEAAPHDQVAREICKNFARRCADYAYALLERNGMLNGPAEAVVSGGVFKEHTGILFADFAQWLRARAVHAQPVNAAYEPVVGAMKCVLPAGGVDTLLQEAETHSLTRLKGVHQ